MYPDRDARSSFSLRVFATLIGGEIIYFPFGIHTRGVDRAELSFVCLKKSGRLIDRTHKVKKAGYRIGRTVSRQCVLFCIYCSYKARAGGKIAEHRLPVLFKRVA